MLFFYASLSYSGKIIENGFLWQGTLHVSIFLEGVCNIMCCILENHQTTRKHDQFFPNENVCAHDEMVT